MKYCYECGHITPGDPLFCQSCARTYNVKLCPRRHVNPRWADVCSQCGSRELSTPQPKVSIGWRLLEWLMRVVLGALLTFLTVAVVVAILAKALKTPQVQMGIVALAILIGLLCWMWSQLPQWLRDFVRMSLRRKRDHHE